MIMVAEPEVKIQDYILDKDVKDYAKSPSLYDIVLQNNTDFIISLKKGKTDRELVVLISKGLFYFRNRKGTLVEEVTLSKLKSFFRDLKDESISLDNVLWLPSLDKYALERLDRIISDKFFVDMCRHNLLSEIADPGWYSGYWKQNEKLFTRLHSTFPTITDRKPNKYRSSFPILFELDKRYGFNDAVFFAETLLHSGIEQFTAADERYWANQANLVGGVAEYLNHNVKGFTQMLDEPYNLNLRRLVEYIFYDAYSQGIANIGADFWRTYKDCLSMQISVYGRIKEKYPKALKTEHDIVALKANKAEIAAKCEDFTARIAEVSDLAYDDKIYSIIVPNTPQQLADEGINLSHCVGSYLDRIISGGCHILFLRRSCALEESLVTLQLSKGRINQAEGNYRRKINADERRFLMKWGTEKNIEIAV